MAFKTTEYREILEVSAASKGLSLVALLLLFAFALWVNIPELRAALGY